MNNDRSKHRSPDPGDAPGTTDPREADDRADDDLPVDVGPLPEVVAETGEAVDFRDRWLRAEADLQNYRRRAQRDQEESKRAAEDRLLREVVEVLDDLDRALAATPASAQDDAWRTGVTLVAGKMRELLSRSGVTPMVALGQPFDPHQHEALLEVDAPEGRAPGEVVTVIRAGYRRDDRVLRPARVAVARARVESR